MRVNMNITPYCRAVINEWASERNTTFDGIVNALISFAFENGYTKPPITISNAEEVHNNTIHIVVEIWNEDYIASVNTLGKRSIKISRIIEYLITYEVFDKTYLDIVELPNAIVDKRESNKTTFYKFLEQEQTRLAMSTVESINLIKEILSDNVDIVWPILKFATVRLNINTDVVDYIEKVLKTKESKHET